MNEHHAPLDASAQRHLLAVTFLLGSIWGLVEALAGSTMRSAFPPLRAALCTGIGMGILGFGAGAGFPRRLMAAIALVAASTMMLAVPILRCSPLCRANAMLAVTLHGTMLAAYLPLAERGGRNDLRRYGAAAFLAALSSSLLFHTLGLRLAPCQYLLSFGGEWGLARFLLREGIPWALFSAVFFPAGLSLGRKNAGRISRVLERRPTLWYGASAVSIALCLLAISASLLWGR
ncbi:MAG: hypothetical protein JXA20_15045 [Spirochaetes bacterium]|nr:hypothetical protein [Spirochaetota bacterium]